MFKIESYITPLILSYVDKYIKNLKPEDSQVSLWGGDAVFNNLDLRLDVLEQELGTPFSFVNGHIHELRIHVPWTKLGSEPVVITINTIECILKLSEDASSDLGSSTGEHPAGTGATGSIKVRGEPKVAGKLPEDNFVERSAFPPPNYVQSLINRVVNNISIICNNVILKYVEDDIVLSLNAKSVEIFAVNNKWERAFVDLALPELILRKVIRLVDLTVCLDRRDASGKISIYQDPLLYRCSLDCRLHMAFESLYGNRLLTTKLDILCDQLDFSITDHQLTMFLRLIELGLALKANEIASAQPKPQEPEKDEPDKSEAPPEGWSSWLWSYIPSGISQWSEGDSTDEGRNLSSPVFHFGLYVKKASYMFKIEESVSDVVSGFSSRKINFRPLCGFIVEAQYMDVVMRGIDVFNLKMGMSAVTGVLVGMCPCGVMDSNSTEGYFFIAGIEKVDDRRESHSSHNLFIKDSLFDDESIENNGQHREYCFDWDQHFHLFSDEYIREKTPAFALDYFYLLEIPDDVSEKSSGISVTDLENSSLKERAFIRMFITSPRLDINSSVIHRYQTIMAATTPYDYEPYAKNKEESMTDNNALPTAEDVLSLEKFIPNKILKFMFIRPVVRIAMPNHPGTVEEAKANNRRSNSKLVKEVVNVNQLPMIIIKGTMLEFQQRVALYPKRVVKIVSVLRSPSDYLMMNSHYFFGIELNDGCAFVTFNSGESEVELPFIKPCHITYRKKSLLLPSYWKSPTQPSEETSYEISQITVITTAPQLILLKIVWASWFESSWRLKQLLDSSVIHDTFVRKSAVCGSSLKFKISDFLWKRSYNDVMISYAGVVGRVAVEIEHIDSKSSRVWTPVFYGPQVSTAAHTLNFFTETAFQTAMKDELLSEQPFFKFIFQIPADYNNIITPVVFFLYVQNSVLCFDSRLTNWISYRPFVRDVAEPIRQVPPAMAEPTDNDGQSKESKGSCVSIGGGMSPTEASRTTVSCNNKRNQNSNLRGPMEFVSDWYPILQKLSIQIDFEGMHVFFCKSCISWSFESEEHRPRQLLYGIQQMVLNQKSPQTLAVNFPVIKIVNDGQKMSFGSNHVDIPVTSINGHDKFPWSIHIENYSAFTLDRHDTNYLLAPDIVAATFAINSKSGQLNFAQLNVCLHCDFQPVYFHLSQPQAKLAVSIMKDHVVKGMSFLSMISSSGSHVLVPSVHTWPFLYEASTGDHKSRKASTVSSIIEKDKSAPEVLSFSANRSFESGNKVSLWLQTTLPKLVLDVVGKNHENSKIRVCFEMEDITCSFDVQEVYSKLKLKVASVKARNYLKVDGSSEWKLGDYEGITFSSAQQGNRLYATNIMHFGGEQSHDHGSKPGDLPGSFLIATFTRVQRKNVQKRWAKILRERSGGDESLNSQTMGLANDNCRSRFISEIDLKLMPMEIVFQVPIAKCIFSVTQPLSELLPPAASSNSTSSLPKFSTATLPLMYFSCTDVSILFPHLTINRKREVMGDKQKDDLVVLQVSSIDLTPNADNPLSRIIIKQDIFNVAQRAGILKIPGSEVEDRQYQIDIKGFALSTGLWEQLVQSSNIQSCEVTHSKTMGENPAVEWNLKASLIGNVFPKTTLCPLISSFDLRIVAAPAIVYEKSEFGCHHNDVVIAGHSLEINVATNVVIYCGLHQLDLLLQTTSLFEPDYDSFSQSHLNSTDLMRKTLNKKLKEMDSGIESEATSSPGLLFGYPGVPSAVDLIPLLTPLTPPATILPVSPLALPNSLPQNSSTVVDNAPYEVLLTAGLITVVSYFPEHYLNVPKDLQFPKYSGGRLHSASTVPGDGLKHRKRFQSPERTSQSSSSEADDLRMKRSRHKNKSKEHPSNNSDTAVGYDGSVESSDGDSSVNEEQGTGIIPMFHMIVSQPYTLVKFNKGAYKWELSCFDVSIRGVNALRPIQSDSRLPKLQHYNATWLDTVYGDADSKTGIHPSFYTLTVTYHVSKKPNVTLKVEKPVRFVWDSWKYDKLLFLVSNLSIFKTKNVSSQKSGTAQWQTWMRLLESAQCTTKQIMLVLEATEAGVGDARMIFSLTDSSTVASFQCQTLKNEDVMTDATLSIGVGGCLLKNQFLDPEPRPLVGPFSLTFDSTIKWEKWALSPFILTKLTLDTVIVNIDQTHLDCLTLVANNLLTEKTAERTEESPSGFNWFPDFNESSDGSQIWQDDLRVGIFQYTQNSDDPSALPLLPGPNEIVFRKEQAGYGASMTWKYPEPRVLIRTEIHPVPFRAAADEISSHSPDHENFQTEVSCALQYYDQLRASFVTYRMFCLSETEPCILDLPLANLETKRELVVSSIWRVLMNYCDSDGEDDSGSVTPRSRCAVSPLALAACMRVDSCFRSSLIPSVQFLFTVDIMKVTLWNRFTFTEGPNNFYGVAPFILDGTMPPYQEFIVASLENIRLFDRHWHNEFKAELEIVLRLEIVDYYFLTLQPLMDPVCFRGQLSASRNHLHQKPNELEILINVGHIITHLEPQSLHTLILAGQMWAERAVVDKEYYLLSAFLICNNTLETIRFGQVDTDENIVLASQQAHTYSWRTARSKQVIHVCVEGMRWKWCEPFSISNEGTQVIEVASENRKATLVVRVKQLNPIQKQVIISGQLLIANRLSFPLVVRIKRNTRSSPKPSEEITAVVPASGYLPSFVIQHEHSWLLQLRAVSDSKSKGCSWSVPVSLDSSKNLSPMQVIDDNGAGINFWCNIFKQTVGSATRQLIVLCPLYVARSHMPHQLSFEITTPVLGDSTTVVTLQGKAAEQHLHCPGQPHLQHTVKLRINSESVASSQSFTLKPHSIQSSQKRAMEAIVDVDDICENYSKSTSSCWPYDNCEEQTEIKNSNDILKKLSVICDSPEMELEVTIEQFWPGCDTLLIDIKPWGLLANRSSIDCVLVFTKQSYEESIIIPAHSIVALPKLLTTVKFGIFVDDSSHFSKSFQMTGYDDGWFSYTKSKAATLVYQHLDIPIVTSTTKICFLTLCRMESTKDDVGINIFTLRSRYIMTSFSSIAVAVAPFARASAVCKHELDSESSKLVLIEPNQTQVEILLWELVGDLEEASHNLIPHLKMCHAQDPTNWSIPFAIGFDEEVIGHSIESVYSVVVPCIKDQITTAYRVSCQEYQGSVMLLLTLDETPQFQLLNRCPVALYIAQSTSQPLDDGSESIVAEEYSTAFVSELAKVESFSSSYYTLPFVTQKFPKMYDPLILPRLHLAEGSTKSDTGLEWSSGIHLTSETDQFITIPNCGDIKVHMERTSATTHMFLDPINRIEVSAKEIRSRIKKRSGESVSGRKFGKGNKPATPILKWKIEEIENVSNLAPTSPSPPPPPSKPATKVKDPLGWSVYGVCHLSHICFVLSENGTEIIRVNVDHLQMATRSVNDLSAQSKRLHRLKETASQSCMDFLQEVLVCVGDLQVDNQLQFGGGHDFPVVLLRQNETPQDVNWSEISSARRHSLITLTTVIQGSSTFFSKWLVKDVEVNIQPIAMYAEDSLLYVLFGLTRNINWSFPPMKRNHVRLLQPPTSLVVRRLVVHPITLLLSLRVSSKVFISFDHTPLNFKAFERTHIWTTWHQLGHTLAVHYMSGALVCAGWVIGSMDLLANPGGFARAVGTGVSDLFRLPYRGLLNGPWAFVGGIVQGTASLLNHIGSGTVLSITNLASSISRNMDHLAMDHIHLERNEEIRRSPPQGLTAGLSQGLTGLGISLLGAMAGIVHQPLQSIHGAPAERPLTHTAAGLISGVGRGLVGIVVKPIGGAAEFVAQAGQGILHGAGWIKVHKPRYEPVIKDPTVSSNSLLKYIWKMLPNSRSSSDLILAVEATNVNAFGNYVATSLLLTSEVLFVVNLDTDSQQQAFGLAELDCQADNDDPTLISFYSKESTEDGTKDASKQSDRVAEFVDRTSKYTAKGNRGQSTIDESQSSSSSCSSPSSYNLNPWISKTPITPIFNFYLPPRFRDTFHTCYVIAQRKILGKGFN